MQVISVIKQQKERHKLSHLYLMVGSQGKNRKEILKQTLEILLDKNFNDVEQALAYSRCFHITAENTVIKKEQVLSLQEEFSKSSLESGYRVYIIEDVDQLNQASANSLLKFMEEPAGQYSIGLLFTNKPQAILETIISRAQIFRIDKQNQDETLGTLSDLGIPSKDIQYLMSFDPTLEIAQERYLQPYYQEVISIFEKYVKNLSERNKKDSLISTSALLSEDVLHMNFFISLVIQFFLDIIKYPNHIHFIHFKEIYEMLKHGWTQDVLYDFIERLNNINNETRYFVSLDLLRRKCLHIMEEMIL